MKKLEKNICLKRSRHPQIPFSLDYSTILFFFPIGMPSETVCISYLHRELTSHHIIGFIILRKLSIALKLDRT